MVKIFLNTQNLKLSFIIQEYILSKWHFNSLLNQRQIVLASSLFSLDSLQTFPLCLEISS